jgi:hypothetical protein
MTRGCGYRAGTPKSTSRSSPPAVATKQSEWWPGGKAPLLDVQAELDPFKPRSMMNEIMQEFGERAEIVVIGNASQALIPEQPTAVTDAIVTWIGELPKR